MRVAHHVLGEYAAPELATHGDSHQVFVGGKLKKDELPYFTGQFPSHPSWGTKRKRNGAIGRNSREKKGAAQILICL